MWDNFWWLILYHKAMQMYTFSEICIHFFFGKEKVHSFCIQFTLYHEKAFNILDFGCFKALEIYSHWWKNYTKHKLLGILSVIRPMTSHPHTKNVKKHDPVSRYQQYRESWTSQRAPGEKNHKSLRWNVREQMLHHDQVIEKVRFIQ